MATTVDPAFEGAGQAPGVELWRIEQMKPVKLARFEGKLHTGDAYILLSTTAKGPGGSGGRQWALHFWLGAESSQDEQGTAAIKAVELDDALGGAPVQYREVEGHESPLFLSYFKSTGLEILPGGVASGFNKVEPDNPKPRLLHLKGARVVRAKEVPLAAASLCVDDAFLLDAGAALYLWHGPEASRKERGKALEMALRIRDGERGGKPALVLVEDGGDQEDVDAFWKLLGGQVEVTRRSAEGDAEAEAAAAKEVRLRRVSDASGTLEVEEVVPDRHGRLTRAMLDSKDVFVLDVGSEVFVWIGKETTPGEKQGGMGLAAAFLEQSGRALATTPITRLVEQGETAAFKAHFAAWDPPITPSFGHRGSVGVAPSVEGEAARHVDPAEVSALAARVAAEEGGGEEEAGADGGEVKVWRIDQLEKVEVPPEKQGHFYGGDSYVVLHTAAGGTGAQTIYIWQGATSSTDEKGAAALHAVALDDSLGGKPVQVRVVQGKEPAHFRRLFRGRLVVHSGGVRSGFRRLSGSGGGEAGGLDESESIGPALFQVKGRTAADTYAVQLEAKAVNLNSGDCFLLLTPEDGVVYAWLGRGANAGEKEAATALAECVKASSPKAEGVSVVEEGGEPDGFWAALGGIATYPTTKAGEAPPREPRLFHVSNATGRMRVEEIPAFAQSDLADEDVMLLDTYTTVFAWVGRGANTAERAEALRVAQAFVEQAAKADGRDPRTPVVKVAAGAEPPLFTQHFLGWDPAVASGAAGAYADPYEARVARLRAEREAAKRAQEENAGAAAVAALRPTTTTTTDNAAAAATTTPAAGAGGKPLAVLAVGEGEGDEGDGEPATPLPSSTAVSPASSARKSPTVSPTPSPSSAATASRGATGAAARAMEEDEEEAVAAAPPAPAPAPAVATPVSGAKNGAAATPKSTPKPAQQQKKGAAAAPEASKASSLPSPSAKPKPKPKWPPSPTSSASSPAPAPTPAPAPAPAKQPAPAAAKAAVAASSGGSSSGGGGGIPGADASDPAKRETLLSDKEFEAAFKMSKPEFYGLPLWRQRALKKQAGLF